MLAARGVSLGLGKINLSDLHNLPDRATIGRTRKSKDVPTKPKLRVRKHVDKK
uniref:Small basic protein n=1 Tax=Steinernema glaseri TaxID=37863 RepID=A0A1I7Z370_9BILA